MAEVNAFDYMRSLFAGYGLGELWDSHILPALTDLGENATEERLMPYIENTDTYRERFKANEVRKQKGLRQLSIAEYVRTEENYRDMMQAAGLPPSFYDEPEDFTRWIENNVSADTAQQRVTAARKWVQEIDPAYRRVMRDDYGVDSDQLTAYALDPERGLDLIERQYDAAIFKGTAAKYGSQVDTATAELYGSTTDAQGAAQRFAQVAAQRKSADKLSSVYGEQLTEQDLITSAFNGDGADKVNDTVKSLTAKEQATFGGSSAADSRSLSKKRSSGI